MKEPSKTEVINDINGDLISLYRVIQHHLEEFVRQFKWALTSRQIFKWLQDTPPETLTDIQRAARFYYLQKLCFGGKVIGQSFGTATTSTPRLNLMRMEEELSAAHLRLSRVFIEHESWQDCVKRYDRKHTFFYCDPPYYGTEGYGVGFGLEEYSKLAEVAKTMQGKILISLNDIPEMRDIFKDFTIHETKISYTLSGKTERKQINELIIQNW